MLSWLYFIGRLLVIIILLLLTNWQVKGKKNIPAQGSLLVVSNHINLADPPVIGASLNRKALFMAKEELFRSRLTRYFISSLGAFPVYRGKLDRKALRHAEKALADGSVLVMFPEATRSKNAQLQPAFSGSAMIAQKNNVQILPIGITGTEKLRNKTWFLRRPRITVNIGTPFYLPSSNGKLTKSELPELTTLIMEHIADILPAEYQGVYAKQGKKNDTKN
ncbi:lysophospholipid acyltransferase family protein [Chloroflexota bacterium]